MTDLICFSKKQAINICELSEKYRSTKLAHILEEINKKTNDLLRYFLENFSPIVILDDLQDLFTSNTKKILKGDTVEFSTVPIRIIRELLFDYKIPVKLFECHYWNEFVMRYNKILYSISRFDDIHP